MIEITGLNKKYGKQRVLTDISLELEKGQSIALIGPNGSGKTTLIKCVLGLVKPSSGRIVVDGQDVSQGCSYRDRIGYMPQISRFPDHMKVSALFRMIRSLRPQYSTDDLDTELYDAFGIDGMQDKALGELSGGMRQKVSAALAFLFDPPILILDEPTAGLDPVSNERFKEKVEASVQKEKLVLISSHILSELDDVISQVIYLMEGELTFFKSLEQLKEETVEDRLNKIIAKTIQN